MHTRASQLLHPGPPPVAASDTTLGGRREPDWYPSHDRWQRISGRLPGPAAAEIIADTWAVVGLYGHGTASWPSCDSSGPLRLLSQPPRSLNGRVSPALHCARITLGLASACHSHRLPRRWYRLQETCPGSPGTAPRPGRPSPPVRQPVTLTFSAWGPFWPCVMPDSTFCPSSRLR